MSSEADKRLRKKRRKGMVNPLTRIEEWREFAFRKGKKIQDFFFFFKPCSSQYAHLMAILHWLGKKLRVPKVRETEEAAAETENQAHQGS